jgi:magnesium chelatase accessory protein
MGEGPLLLLIHGAGGATQSWRHLMPLLAKKYRTIAVDLPGQGFTKLGAQRRCGLDEMSADLQQLANQQGWHPVALIGHSAGAAIALRMAEEMTPPPQVIGLNAALGNFKGLAGVLFPIMAKMLAAMPGVAQLFTASAARPQSVERLISGTGSTLSSQERRFYQALVSDRGHVDATLSMMAQWSLDGLLSRLPDHPARSLLIAASNDKSVPPSTSRDAAARMPDADFIELPGLGHLAHEEAAETVLHPIQSFLAA